MSDHQWVVLSHLGTLISLTSFLCGIVVWFKKRGREAFKRVVSEAVKEAIAPVSEKVDLIWPWYQEVVKYVDPKQPNGKAFKKEAGVN